MYLSNTLTIFKACNNSCLFFGANLNVKGKFLKFIVLNNVSVNGFCTLRDINSILDWSGKFTPNCFVMFNVPAAVLSNACPASDEPSALFNISVTPLVPPSDTNAPMIEPKSVTSHCACISFFGDIGIAILIRATHFLVVFASTNPEANLPASPESKTAATPASLAPTPPVTTAAAPLPATAPFVPCSTILFAWSLLRPLIKSSP